MTFKVKDGVSIAGTLFVDGNRNIVAQAVTATSITATQAVSITTTTQSVNTYTGALTVTGGAGIGGNLYASAIYDSGNRVLTTATVGTYGVTSIIAGTDTAVSGSTGAVTIWNTSTLQSITNRGNTTTNPIYANALYDNNNRVVTNVTPSGSTYIGVQNIVSTGTATSFTITNLGVTNLIGTLNLGISNSTGTITLTNLGVTATIGSSYIGVSANTGSVTITNLGVQTLTAGTDTVVTSSTGTVTVYNTSTLQSVTNRGSTTTNAITINNATSATSTNSGALQVIGGVGVGGALYAGPIYSNGQPVLTSGGGGSGYVISVSGGTDISVNTTTGNVIVSDTSTLQSVTNRGSTTTNAINITNTTSATSTASGALKVVGGVGIGGDLYVGGKVVAQELDIQYTTITTTLVQSPDIFMIQNTTVSTNTTTGALQVYGGVGIGGNLNVGGTITRNGISVGYGYTGSLGYTGSQGYAGSAGYNGSQGYYGSTGYYGSSGYNGSVGYTGSAGYNGSMGYWGSTGYYGSAGYNGSVGYTGSSGYNGSQGYYGSTGYYGSSGYNGSVGYTGSAGFNGSMGYWGSAGYNGSVGYTGSSGYNGSQGYYGSTGYTGSSGYNGSQGYWGSVGYTGSAGYNGSMGYWGSVGYTGSNGYHGSAGFYGSVGYTGSAGYNGSMGYWGSAGYNGSVGYTGSAGFNGSMGYWGSTGYTGSAGYNGSMGYWGSTGYSGSAGYTGSAGYNGSMGYWGSVGYSGSAGYTGSQGYAGSAGPSNIINATNTTSNTLYPVMVAAEGSNQTAFASTGFTFNAATNSLYLTGDLYVDGTQTYVNSTAILSGDKVLALATATGSALLAANSGIEVGTTATPYASLLFDGTSNWVVGGSAATGIKAANITDTGLSTPGQVVYAGTSGLLSGSSNHFWDNTNTRLGIGTASPSYTLDVSGTIRSSVSSGNNLIIEKSTGGFISFTQSGTQYGGIQSINAANGLQFFYGASEAMRIDSGGNLDINYTSSQQGAKLSVNGGAYINGITTATSQVVVNPTGTPTSQLYVNQSVTFASAFDLNVQSATYYLQRWYNNGTLIGNIATNASNALILQNATTAVTLSPSNVGIGYATTQRGELLSVNGGAYINGAFTATGVSYFGSNVSVGTTSPYTTGGTALLTVYDAGAGSSPSIAVGASSSDEMYVRRLSAGNYQIQSVQSGSNAGSVQIQPYGGSVGVGTTSPSSTLNVVGSSNDQTSGIYTQNTNVGASALSGLTIGNNLSSNQGGIVVASSNKTASGFFGPSSTYLYNVSGLIAINAQSSNPIIFGTNNTEYMRLDANGALAFNGATNYGSSGQYLQSNGDAPPTWVTPSVSSFSSTANTNAFEYIVGVSTSTASTATISVNRPLGFNASTGYVGINTASPADPAGFNVLAGGLLDIYGPMYTRQSNLSTTWFGVGIPNSGGIAGQTYLDAVGPSQTINFMINNSTKVTIDNTGNLDVGYTSAQSGARLSVNGGAYVNGAFTATGAIYSGASFQAGTSVTAGYYQDASNGAYRSIVTSGTSGYYFQNNAGATTYMYVGLTGTYAGNVGIGTITPANLLTVNGTGALGSTFQTKVTNGTQTLALGANATAAEVQSQGGVPLYINYGGNNVCLVANGSGSVGIGTGSPNATLEIDATTPSLRLQETSASNKRLDLSVNSSGVASIGANQSAQVLTFSTVGTEAIRITSSQQVGIGITNPSYQLVVSNAGAQGLEFNPTGGINSGGFVQAYNRSGSEYFDLTYYAAQHHFTIGASEKMTITSGGLVGINTTTPGYTLQVAGSFAATTKSFVIDHPTKPGYDLRYGSLEGPENGVYVRGRVKGNTIELPDYWTKLVDPDTITVNLTPVGKHQKLYVEKIENNVVTIGNDNLFGKAIDCFYTVYGERCDVESLVVEIQKPQ